MSSVYVHIGVHICTVDLYLYGHCMHIHVYECMHMCMCIWVLYVHACMSTYVHVCMSANTLLFLILEPLSVWSATLAPWSP